VVAEGEGEGFVCRKEPETGFFSGRSQPPVVNIWVAATHATVRCCSRMRCYRLPLAERGCFQASFLWLVTLSMEVPTVSVGLG